MTSNKKQCLRSKRSKFTYRFRRSEKILIAKLDLRSNFLMDNIVPTTDPSPINQGPVHLCITPGTQPTRLFKESEGVVMVTVQSRRQFKAITREN
ncbi:hypothetical protein CEXT_77091 [Caerostris extrusa]|uniref:Uncharacterized protein n=1 Tax=Caerostris extrusa TaxID=172846 RepID=A0AAV4MTL6_CAEEX|nr:hypothetical protein CEXT_77091 [Caerostris extrusa]